MRSIMDAVRREGGSLEFMPMLMNKDVRKEIGLGDEFDTVMEAHLAAVQKSWEEERQSATSAADKFQPMPMKERLAKETERMDKLLAQLSPEQRSRMIGVFVQWRNFRSVSNRLVVEKLGMSAEKAAELRQNVENIREEIMDESRDRFRQIFENGGDRAEFQTLVHKNQEKIDDRIEKLLSKEEIAKLTAVRGKEVSKELLQSLDRPPSPPPRPR